MPLAHKTTCDVLVIGSGSAALAAALRAAHGGLEVLILEKTKVLGGTTAISGAGIWVPANHVAEAACVRDSRAEALAYLRATGPDGWLEAEDHLWQNFTRQAPDALRFIADHTPLEFVLVNQPDPYSELEGGKTFGRMVTPKALRRGIAGALGRRIRQPTMTNLLTYQELIDYDLYHHPVTTTIRLLPRLAWRVLTNARAQGNALIIGLVKGCLDAGCRFELEARATELVLNGEHDAVSGAVVRQRGQQIDIEARRGVVLATGGFEWDRELLSQHFPGPMYRLGSPRSNEGDGQKMAAAAGAQLDRMDQANVYPCLPMIYENQPHGIPLSFQADSHAVVVDHTGKRFVNELDFNIGEVMDRRDPDTGKPIHMPAWVIADSRFLQKSPILKWFARYDPKWWLHAESLDDLAKATGLPADALKASITRFNKFADSHRDEDFGRGQSYWDSAKSAGGIVRLGTIEKPPFVAISFGRSLLGTKGGARTNEHGQVLRPDGSIIGGLYAAGLAMANPIGTRAVGAGTTIGPNLTWGYICGASLEADHG